MMERDRDASMRVFVALRPPAEALDHLARYAATLNVAAASRPDPSRWHITLAFIGEVRSAQLASAVDALSAAVTGTAAPRLRLAGGGRFARPRDSVLWAGVDGEAEALSELAATVRTALRAAEVPVDDTWPFTPHLTLAYRLKNQRAQRDVEELSDYRGPQWTATAATLYRTMSGRGPRYLRLAEFTLDRGGR
jgi:2'-5' RNA ligase